jgi:hypothetical protein
VEAHNTTRYQHPLEYLKTTRKRKPKAVEQSTRRKKTPSSKKRLGGKCSMGNACTTRRASILLFNVKPFGGPLELCQVHEERRRDYPTNDLLINFVPDSRRLSEGLFWCFVCLNHCFGTLSRNKRLRAPTSTPYLSISQGRYLCLFTRDNHDSLAKLREPCYSRTMRPP